MNNNTTMHRPNSTIQQQQHVLLVQSTDESDEVNVINKSSREALIKTPEGAVVIDLFFQKFFRLTQFNQFYLNT